MLPFLRRNNPGNEIEGKDTLGPFIATVDGEGDPLVEIRLLGEEPLAIELSVGHFRKAAREALIMGTHNSRRRKHLVKKIADLVFLEQPVHHVSLPNTLRSFCRRRPIASRSYSLRNLKIRSPAASRPSKFRIEEPGSGRFFPADSVGLGEACLTQSGQRGPEENRPKSPPTIFLENTRTGRQVILDALARVHDRGSDDSMAMLDNDAIRRIRRKTCVNISNDDRAKHSLDVTPAGIHAECVGDDRFDRVALVFVGPAQHERRRDIAFFSWKRPQVPFESQPAERGHRGMVS